MTNNQLIKKIETKIEETQKLIQTQEKALTHCKSTLANLITQLNEIKKQLTK